jgi:hypothetical protein
MAIFSFYARGFVKSLTKQQREQLYTFVRMAPKGAGDYVRLLDRALEETLPARFIARFPK